MGVNQHKEQFDRANNELKCIKCSENSNLQEKLLRQLKMNAKFLLCVLALVMCSLVKESSAQYGYGYASSYYPTSSYYYGNAYGTYGAAAYGGYGLGSAYAGYYGKREAGFGPNAN